MKWLLLVDLVLSRQVVLMVAMQVVVLVIQLVFVLDLVWMVFHVPRADDGGVHGAEVVLRCRGVGGTGPKVSS